ncbi:MAG: hypothetical protein L0226_09350, partial [Acidobacteria bacterium]|nr:hypothetical protein [Acidobacteriota bacterium]
VCCSIRERARAAATIKATRLIDTVKATRFILYSSENVQQPFQVAVVPAMVKLMGQQQPGKVAVHRPAIFVVSGHRLRRHG